MNAITTVGTTLALALVGATGLGSALASEAESHAVLGAFPIESAVGGAVWTFRDDGVVRLIGPGGALSMGSWEAHADDRRRFSGRIDVGTTLQSLTFDGVVSSDDSAIAIVVSATEPGEDAGRFVWPSRSELVGLRLGFVDVTPDPSPSPASSMMPFASAGSTFAPVASPGVAAPTPMPTAASGECAAFEADQVDWGPCDTAAGTGPSADGDVADAARPDGEPRASTEPAD